MNNSITFQKELLGVQDDLLRFAYKLTSEINKCTSHVTIAVSER